MNSPCRSFLKLLDLEAFGLKCLKSELTSVVEGPAVMPPRQVALP